MRTATNRMVNGRGTDIFIGDRLRNRIETKLTTLIEDHKCGSRQNDNQGKIPFIHPKWLGAVILQCKFVLAMFLEFRSVQAVAR